MSPFKKPVSVRKATNYAIVINGLQILLILVMLFAVVIVPEIETSYHLLLTLTIVASLVIIWGAVVDIREALSTRIYKMPQMPWGVYVADGSAVFQNITVRMLKE